MSSILIVEDEVLTSEYLEFVLEEAGYEAIPAASADEAIAVLEHREDVDLVVTDINLPGGLNGLQLAALVRNRWPATNIIVVTATMRPETKRSHWGAYSFQNHTAPKR
jgi:CheY-like chemotaxis protein